MAPVPDVSVGTWHTELEQDLRAYAEMCGLAEPFDMLCDGDLCAMRHAPSRAPELVQLRRWIRRPDDAVLRGLSELGIIHPLDTPCIAARMKIGRRSASPSRSVDDGHDAPFCYVQHRQRTHPRYHGEEGDRMAALCNGLAEMHGDADRVRYLRPDEYRASDASSR